MSRLDATTLRVRPAEGFLKSEGERMMRSLSRPFHTGDEVALSDVRVRVSEVTADGRPAQADFSFNVPLEDPSLLWMQWRAGAERTVTLDEAYYRRSIQNPGAELVKGYPPVMPKAPMNHEDLNAVIEYLRTLK